MTDQPTSSVRRRAAGIAASALVLANVLATPAAVMAAGGPGTPPVLVNDVITTSEDTPATGNVLANDTNSSGVTPFTVTTFTGPAASVGTLTIAANGSYTFTPAPNFSGSGTATYMASNTKHEVGPATITINVTPVQDPPNANDDTITVVEDTPTNVTSAILANDVDPDGDTISVTGVSNASGGVVSGTSSVTFTPAANLCGAGAGSFDYSVAATGGTDSAHVTVNITCVDDAPTAVDDSASGTEDTDVSIPESLLVANDTDPENDTLTVSGVSNASGGSVSRSGGTVTFKPSANLCGNGAASFDYTVNDGNGGTDTGTVTIDLACVQDPPVAVDDTASGTEDTDVSIDPADLVKNDTDPDNDTLSVTAVSNPSGGTVKLDAGTITFTPDANLCGAGKGSFDYTVDDGNGNTDTGSVSIDLDCTNDAPVANDDTVTATEGTPTDVTASLLSNDTDIDGDDLAVSDVSSPVGGTVDLTGGVVTFTPTAGPCGDGIASFDYQVSDGHGGMDSATATVNVACANDAPVANDDTANGTEDTNVSIPAADLTGNDTDADNDSLSVTDATNAVGGTVSLDTDTNTVTFTPDANACDPGPFGFDYTVSDGTATDTGHVDVSIKCVNDAPVAVDDSKSGTEDTDVTVDAADLVKNDTDVENDTLTVTDAFNAVGGTVKLDSGTVTFTPDADACDPTTFSFDYTVSDGTDTATGHVDVTIKCVNDAPVAVADTFTDASAGVEDTDLTVDAAVLLANDTDVDTAHDGLSVSAVDNATGGTVSFDSVTGKATFTPTANACDPTPFGFDYTVSDGTDTATGHVSISIKCVNDAPVAVDDSKSGSEDTDLVVDGADLVKNDTDVENDTLTVTDAFNAVGGTVSFSGGKATFTPTANACDPTTFGFDYTVSDGTDTATGHVDVSIECVDDAPVAVDDVATVAQDSPAADHDVLANDTDIDTAHDALTLKSVLIDNAAHGTATVNGTMVRYTPAAGFAGQAVITYTVDDGADGTDTGTLTVTVTATPPSDTTPPTVHAATVTFASGRIDSTAPLRISWSASDPSGVTSYEVQVKVGTKQFAALSKGSATSIVKFYPFRQTLVFRVRATDGKGNTSGWVSTTRKIVPFQNASTKIVYRGRWSGVVLPACSGNGYSYTRVAGGKATLAFTGRSVLYVAPRSKASGWVKVYVDGKLLGRFNLKSSTVQLGKIIASKTWAANGKHTIRVVNDQAGARTNLDAFIVLQ